MEAGWAEPSEAGPETKNVKHRPGWDRCGREDASPAPKTPKVVIQFQIARLQKRSTPGRSRVESRVVAQNVQDESKRPWSYIDL